MVDFSKLRFEELLRPEGYNCPCGHHHGTKVKRVVIGRGAIASLVELLDDMGARKPFIVCDPNTYGAAGERAINMVAASGREYLLARIREGDPEPDEYALGQLCMAFDPSCDVILAVGSGVINDLCKMLALITGRRAFIVGTAPSMDGFASNSSSMLVGGVKTSVYNPCPETILLDTEIMAAAPMRMLHAGLGDMLAKYISVCEWRLSNLITGEYYCDNIGRLVRRSADTIVAQADMLPARDPDAIGNIAEGLVMSGVTMSYAGTSRPASGLEHYFSHVWDMRAIEAGKRPDLHGIQVGVGTLLTLRIYDWIREITPDRERAERHMRNFDEKKWEGDMRRVFGKVAPEIFEIERQTRKNDPVKHAARLEIILRDWDKIMDIINSELPPRADIESLARRVGMPMTPEDIGIGREDVYDAFIGAKDIRDKYMSCNLLWDLGLLDEFAERLRDEV